VAAVGRAHRPNVHHPAQNRYPFFRIEREPAGVLGPFQLGD